MVLGIPDHINESTSEKIRLRGKETPLTLVSMKFWNQIGQRKLEENNHGIEASESHAMESVGAFFSTVLSNNKLPKINSVVVDDDTDSSFYNNNFQLQISITKT